MGYRIDEPHEIYISGADVLRTVQELFIGKPDNIGYRGHRCASWALSPTLTRYLDRLSVAKVGPSEHSYDWAAAVLQESFRENVLFNEDLRPADILETDLWQYGQHYGLPSPLLDWTYSPYVGLFFSLVEEAVLDADSGCEPRALWALNLNTLHELNTAVMHDIRPKLADAIAPKELLEKQIPLMEVVGRIDGYNRRLAYQQGFFTKHIFYSSFEVWARRIARETPFNSSDRPLLTKIVFQIEPDTRFHLLEHLHMMNINHRSLFPDIAGSVQHARFVLESRYRQPRFRSSVWHNTKFDPR